MEWIQKRAFDKSHDLAFLMLKWNKTCSDLKMLRKRVPRLVMWPSSTHVNFFEGMQHKMAITAWRHAFNLENMRVFIRDRYSKIENYNYSKVKFQLNQYLKPWSKTLHIIDNMTSAVSLLFYFSDVKISTFLGTQQNDSAGSKSRVRSFLLCCQTYLAKLFHYQLISYICDRTSHKKCFFVFCPL